MNSYIRNLMKHSLAVSSHSTISCKIYWMPASSSIKCYVGLTPSTGPNLHHIQKNFLLQTQICPHPNILTPLLWPTASAVHAVPTGREIADVTLKEPAKPPRSGPPDTSSDRTYRDLEHLLEQLLDSSLATVAIIHFSGNRLADVLTPRARDAFKALYALVALDVSFLSTNLKHTGGDPSTVSTSFSTRDDHTVATLINLTNHILHHILLVSWVLVLPDQSHCTATVHYHSAW